MRTDGSDKAEKTRGNGQLEKSPVQVLKEMMNTDYVKQRFTEVMGEKAPAFIASIMNAAQKSPDLARCEPRSILSSAMVAATLDLPIDSNLGFSAIVPYNVKRKDPQTGKEYWVSLAQFQIMYKGFIQLALRSGQYKKINISPIYEDEFESYDIVTGDVFIHPVEGGYREKEIEEKIIGYVAFFRLLNGYERIEYWSLEKINAHGEKYSRSYKNPNSLWKKDPHVMYAKTVLKNSLSKWGILSVSMQTAMVADQAVIKEYDKPIDGDNVSYIDNQEGVEASPGRIDLQEGADDIALEGGGKVGPENDTKQEAAKDTTARTGAEEEGAMAADEPAPAAEKAAKAAANQEPDPVPAGKPRSNGAGANNLFPRGEESALEEQYQRQAGGVEPPEFR
jgi:recombination protein RecT